MAQYTLNIKPLSINQAYRGRRFATPELKRYEIDLARILPKQNIPQGKLDVLYEFGLSSKSADGDNLIKAFQDAVANFYGFNDKRIYHWDVTKKDVSKGQEYVTFSIKELL